MMKFRLAALSLLLPATLAWAEVTVDEAWVRPTPPGAKLAAGYMRIVNAAGADERLVGASSPAAARVEMHVHIHEGHVMRMRQVPEYRIPANASLLLKPGDAHLMFVDIARPFREGEKIPVTLKFENAGEVKAEFRVGAPR